MIEVTKTTFEVPNHLLVEPSKAAIYGILNLINGKIYIGSAVEVLNRLRTHKARLNLNKHPSKHLQGSYNQYGALAFEFVILEYVADKKDLVTREECWIDLLDATDPKCGYNKRKVATSNLGIKLGPASEERKAKLSKIHKGRIIPQAQRDAARITLTGRKLSPGHIANSIKGRKTFARSEKTKELMRKSAKARAVNNEYQWPHEKGYLCNCRKCLDQKNLIRRLKRYNHEGEFSL